jgi:hypothetical protein
MAVYPLRVEAMADVYPEATERQRGWFSAEEAAKLVRPASLRPVLLEFALAR